VGIWCAPKSPIMRADLGASKGAMTYRILFILTASVERLQMRCH